MSNTRNLAGLLDPNGDVKSRALDGNTIDLTGNTKSLGLPSGTTAQRPTTGINAGSFRFNETFGAPEVYDGTAWVIIESAPTITSIDTTEIDSASGSTTTIAITGTGFKSGATVKAIGNDGTEVTAGTTTVNSSTDIDATFTDSDFDNAKEPYDIKVINSSGLFGILADQINVDAAPIWTTASGSLGTVYEGESVSLTPSATDSDGDTITYSETTSVLSGAGLSLNSSTGAITGTAPSVSGDTTYNFTLRATANSKTTDRAFSILNKDDPITNALPIANYAWYRFGNANDSSGNNRNLSYNGTITHSSSGAYSSSFGEYVEFNGSGTITLPFVTSSSMTFAGWYYSTSSSSTQHLLGDVGGAYNIAFTVQIINSTTVRIVVDASGGPTYNNDFSVSSGTAFGDSTWHHIVCYKNGSTVGAYIDGVSLGTASAATRSGANQLILGGYTSSGGQFNGRMDHVRFFNSALNSTQVNTLYTAERDR